MSAMSPARMQMGGIAVLVILGAVFVAVSSIGIGRYNKCPEIQGDAKYENRKIFLSQLLAAMITIPATIAAMPILSKMTGQSKSSAPLLAMLMGVAGLITSVFTFQIVENDTACVKESNEKNMAIAGMVISIVAILGSGGVLFMNNKPSARVAANTVTPTNQELYNAAT
jgi:hypothetical protein|tara:strand:+ start:670 stop:1176 length:507 start_codon:yes stop_codon:yes gene_type:complete